MSEFTVEPVQSEAHEGRQWGYEIRKDGHPLLRAHTGGTGPCWNIDFDPDDDEAPAVHVCDLDEIISALTALRDSDAHRANEERWA